MEQYLNSLYICGMNTHINKKKIGQPKFERRYLGTTVTAKNYRELMKLAIEDGKDPRHEINYHTRHLEAYLKGKEVFKHGFRRDKEGKIIGPATFRVMQELKEISNDNLQGE